MCQRLFYSGPPSPVRFHGYSIHHYSAGQHKELQFHLYYHESVMGYQGRKLKVFRQHILQKKSVLHLQINSSIQVSSPHTSMCVCITSSTPILDEGQFKTVDRKREIQRTFSQHWSWPASYNRPLSLIIALSLFWKRSLPKLFYQIVPLHIRSGEGLTRWTQDI